jgi:hypothetical protein
MASITIKDKKSILPLLHLPSLRIKAIPKPFNTQLVYYPPVDRDSNMANSKVVPLITHLYLTFKNNKRIKSVPCDINTFDKRNPLSIAALSYILLSLQPRNDNLLHSNDSKRTTLLIHILYIYIFNIIFGLGIGVQLEPIRDYYQILSIISFFIK